MNSKAEILNAWYKEVWIDGNTAAIPNFMCADAQAKGIIPDMSVNPAEFTVLVETLRKMVRDMTVSIPITLDQGDWLAAVVEVKAYATSDCAPIQACGHVMARFKDDKMVEVYNSFDFLTFFEQQGQLPSNVLALLLSGNEITGFDDI